MGTIYSEIMQRSSTVIIITVNLPMDNTLFRLNKYLFKRDSYSEGAGTLNWYLLQNIQEKELVFMCYKKKES